MAKKKFSRSNHQKGIVINICTARLFIPSVLLFVCLGMMILSRGDSALYKSFHEKALVMASPVLGVLETPIAYANAKLDSVRGIWDAQAEIESLKKENEELNKWVQTAMMLKAENKAMQDLLNVEHDKTHEFVTARLIMDTQSSYAKSLLIDAGAEDNVREGQGVIVKNGLLGRVVEQTNTTSRVLLLNDLNSRVPVTIEDTGDRAIMAGTNGDFPLLKHLSPYNTAGAGQKVITSGHGGVFPYGIPVGETFTQEDGSLGVKLYASPDKVQFVQIVNYNLSPSVAGGVFASDSAFATFQ